MPWQSHYSTEGGANQCCSGIVEKLIINQCLEKKNSSDKKI
jgi:hypothetical protein